MSSPGVICGYEKIEAAVLQLVASHVVANPCCVAATVLSAMWELLNQAVLEGGTADITANSSQLSPPQPVPSCYPKSQD